MRKPSPSLAIFALLTLVVWSGICGFLRWLYWLYDGWGGNKIPLTEVPWLLIWVGPCVPAVYCLFLVRLYRRRILTVKLGWLAHVPLFLSLVMVMTYSIGIGLVLGLLVLPGTLVWMHHAINSDDSSEGTELGASPKNVPTTPLSKQDVPEQPSSVI